MSVEHAALEKARHLIELKRYDAALAELPPALADPSTTVQAYCLQAQALLGLHRPKAATDAARRALAQRPDSEWAHRLLALSLLHRGHARAANGHAEEAARLEPESPHALHILAMTRLARRRREAAREAAERSVAANPHSALAYKTVAEVAVARGELYDAETAYRTGLAIDPGDQDLALGLARLLQRLGRHDEAAEAYFAAARADPTDERAREGLTRRGLTNPGVSIVRGFLIGVPAVRLIAFLGGGPDLVAILFGVVLTVGCAMTTLSRVRGIRRLPEHVRAGLRGDIRNAALVWLAVAGLVALALAVWAAAIPDSHGGGAVRAAGFVVAGLAMLVGACALRSGPRPDPAAYLRDHLLALGRLRRR